MELGDFVLSRFDVDGPMGFDAPIALMGGFFDAHEMMKSGTAPCSEARIREEACYYGGALIFSILDSGNYAKSRSELKRIGLLLRQKGADWFFDALRGSDTEVSTSSMSLNSSGSEG